MLNLLEEYINSYVYTYEGEVRSAVDYSLVDGGKRVRPILLLSLLNDYGVNLELGLSSALAIEMIHTYSLCHDDLPAMDNDDYRRGKLSTHKKFGEDIAILAGDALLTESFGLIANDPLLENHIKVELISNLSKYANGMIYGQQLDLKGEGKDLDYSQILQINTYKTSNLLMFSLLAASIIAGKEKDKQTVLQIAEDLGLAFQLQDDVFDLTKTFEELGKMPSDLDNNKSTLVKHQGLKKSQDMLDALFNQVYENINALCLKTEHLLDLVKKIQSRSN